MAVYQEALDILNTGADSTIFPQDLETRLGVFDFLFCVTRGCEPSF